ncbi:MAG: SpoIIE family protein phosphatase [Bacteroidia bacterium]|nr:SpoIIE family protein phosphatase [Bacteroidia bacterium]
MAGMLSKSGVKVFISTLLCLLWFSFLANGQSYSYRNYKVEKGITDEFVYTVVQDNNGYLWIGTGTGLSKFDGFDFYRITFPDSSIDRYVTTSLKDKNGNLWFGCNDGSIYFTRGDELTQISVRNTRNINTMVEGPDNFIYVIPQMESIIKINPDNPVDVKSFNLDPGLTIWSACFTQAGDLLLGTQGNLSVGRFSGDSFSILTTVTGFDDYNVTAINRINDADSYLVGTSGNGVFKLSLSQGTTILNRFMNRPELEMLDVQYIREDTGRNLWVATNGSGVLQMSFSDANGSIRAIKHFNADSGLPGNNAKVVFQDMESNYWIGLFGVSNGLYMLNSLSLSYYAPGTSPQSNNIIYINRLGSDYLLGTPSGFWLYNLDEDNAGSFTDLKKIIGKYEIVTYCVDFKNNVWIGTNGGGVFLRDATGLFRQFYRNGDSSEDYINDIEVDRKYVWLGTLNGVVLLNNEGTKGKLKGRYNNSNGLPHNSINQIFITSDGTAAIAMEADRLFRIDPETGILQGKAVMIGTSRNEIISFHQTRDGHLWASTKGNGVFEFYNDSLRAYTRANNLMTDYCYSILADSVNRIWIGHDGGFSRFDRNTGVIKTFGIDFAKGGLCNPDGMYESSDGKVLIGTTSGFIVYDRKKDVKPQKAPVNNINYVSINDSVYPLKTSYSLPYSKRYNITVNYVGINLKDPEKVQYRTILENFDDDWSAWTSGREIKYPLTDGRYQFMMRSVSEDGLSSKVPVSFEIFIKKPIWRTWWFILSLLALVAGIVTIIVRQREKAQKKIQIYLEKELEARTSVVMKQKDKIELQNIEITDSINYAKRIQTSILPDFGKLKETFKEAFLLFRPRDIVSGDFYWFDKFSDDKFILVCADSTGHGVPGAFMSMIGSTILQDIVTRQRITKPSEILKILDRQIFSTLNQNVELGVSNDGMDMVVCEINITKRHIRFASAMRPVILVLDGEPLYIKGNRCSVGGESVIEKYFDDQEYYLNEGDTLYLFSDGLPDQFGGTDGKKMKIARLKKLIEDVANLPLSGQKEVISKFYDEWKGDHDQVDDILLIGVRL